MGVMETPTQPAPVKTTSTPSKGRMWLIGIFAVLSGVFCGLGTFTFGYGRGASYLSNNPDTCINCHVMQGHYDAWEKSSHARVAVCNDCHLPHTLIGKYVTKADNGFLHSLAFTLQNFHEPIVIKPRNHRVTQGTCIDCHQDFVHDITAVNWPQGSLDCVHCHRDVGHALR